METEKVLDNYVKICEFLLSQATSAPIGTRMDVNLKQFIGHYATVEIEHKPNCKAYLRVYDCPNVREHSPQNYFYAGDDVTSIKKTICEDRPSTDFMKNLIIGWHRYGIKERILDSLKRAVAEANEKLEAEKEIDNFVV